MMLLADRRSWPQSRQSAKLFLQSSELGLPQPLNPPPRFWGEGHTRWRERGWECSNSDEGTYTVVLFICTYFVQWAKGKSSEAGLTFFKAFGIHVLLKPRLEAKCSGAGQIAECQGPDVCCFNAQLCKLLIMNGIFANRSSQRMEQKCTVSKA